MNDSTAGRAGFDNFDYGRAIEAECASCGVVQIPSRGFTNISCPTCNGELSTSSNNSHHSQVNPSSDHREVNLLNDDDTPEEANVESRAGHSPSDSSIQSITTSLQQLSTANATSGLPLQEGFGDSLSLGYPPSLGQNPSHWSKLSKTPTEGHDENEESDICQTCGELKSRHECLQSRLAVFKRGILSRKETSFSIYFIPSKKFNLVFAKISQTEAAAHEGTEIAVVVEEDRSLFVSHHHQLAIKDMLTVSFEVDHGESFSIIGPASVSTFDVQHILARSEERVLPGACLKLAIKYHGEQNALCEDKVRMTLVTGKAKLLIILAIKSPTPFIHSLRQHFSVTTMPKLDRETLRSCHVGLIESIGDLSSICFYLYQYNILTADDKAFLKSLPRPADRIDQLLTIIPKKGNILDIFICILQQSRENQEAAKMLEQKRLQLYENCKQ